MMLWQGWLVLLGSFLGSLMRLHSVDRSTENWDRWASFSLIFHPQGAGARLLQWQYSYREGCGVHVLIKSLLALCLLMSTGQKQAMWPSSDTRWEGAIPREWCESLALWFLCGHSCNHLSEPGSLCYNGELERAEPLERARELVIEY